MTDLEKMTSRMEHERFLKFFFLFLWLFVSFLNWRWMILANTAHETTQRCIDELRKESTEPSQPGQR